MTADQLTGLHRIEPPEKAPVPVVQTDLVTVVIPARDEETFIGPCLDSVLAQDEERLQVIVVDGASRDRTCDIVRQYAARDARVELLHNIDGIIPKSLNIGLRAARGAWLVRIDAHATVPPGYVKGIVSHLRTGRWGGVGGRKDGVGVTPAGRAVAAAMGSRFGAGNSTYHFGTRVQTVEHIPFGAYPTSLLRALGGWNEALRVNQDFELDYRVRQSHHDLLFDPALVVAWHCRQSILALFRQYRRYGHGKAFMISLNPGAIRFRQLAAPVLVAGGIVGVMLLPLLRWPAPLIFGSYALGLAVASVVTARAIPDRPAQVRVPLAFMAMHAGWGLGFWQGVWDVGRRRLNRWLHLAWRGAQS
jgi:cellulose synthase/poly-beta-1,6-N-acetylglucosamine synthase-like glycosyltransferase